MAIKMIIDCISDLHGYYPKLEGGDLLIVAGDLTANDSSQQMDDFFVWLDKQDYKKKVIIAGNHDNYFYGCYSLPKTPVLPFSLKNTEYLCDSGTEFVYYPPLSKDVPDGTMVERRKFKIWGSPWTKTFPGMNPKCKAFTVDSETELFYQWEKIPHDIDILITHSPPFGILDKTVDGRQVGSTGLLGLLNYAFRPKLWVYGHIHEGYGQEVFKESTICVNASHVNERYQPVNPVIRIEL